MVLNLSEKGNYNTKLHCIYPFPIDLPSNEFRLMLNLSEKGNYSPNLDFINKIQKRFLSVYHQHQTVRRRRTKRRTKRRRTIASADPLTVGQ